MTQRSGLFALHLQSFIKQLCRLFGVTTLDVVRAQRFVAETQGWDPRETEVTVIGGHAGITILPLLSRVQGAKFTDEQIASLTHRIQFGGDEVVKAKDGAGSATLSMAYAGARFVDSLLRAKKGEKVTECCFVDNENADVPFFSTPVDLTVSDCFARMLFVFTAVFSLMVLETSILSENCLLSRKRITIRWFQSCRRVLRRVFSSLSPTRTVCRRIILSL